MAVSQIKSAINSFGGLSTDLDPANKNNQTRYNYAENIVISENGNSGSVSNMNDFDMINEIDFQYELVSHKSTPEFTILSFKVTDSIMYIYKYIKINGVDTLARIATINGDFSGCKHISLETSIESDLIHRLYIADGVNQIMSMDIYREGDPSLWNVTYDASDLFINKHFPSSVVINPSIVTGGLYTGKYFYIAKYVSKSGSLSDIIGVTNGINIKRNGDDGGYIDSSLDIHTMSSSGIRLDISGFDASANAISVYRVYYKSSSSNPSVNLIYSNKITGPTINIVDSSSSSVLSDDIHADILYNQDIIASVLAKKDNILLAGDVKYGTNVILDDIGYDVRAFAFTKYNGLRYHNANSPEIKPSGLGTFGSFNDFKSWINWVGTEEDFIFDDVYDSVRYRDVVHRYKFNKVPASPYPDSIERINQLVYGGTGVNVEYEFCNAHLVSAGEGNRRSRDYDSLYKNTSDHRYNYNYTNTKWINVLRDDLTIKYGDIVRNISSMPIRTQGTGQYDIIDITEFGIPHHSGKLDYSNDLIANIFSGYKRNEIYRFACKMTFKDGTSTAPMWISDIRFPSNYIRRTSEDSSGNINNIYSFSAFEAPDDTISGYYDTTGTPSGKIFDTNPYPSLGEDGKIFRSELIVKPLGLKFKFNNLDILREKGLRKIDILYTPMDYYDRSIVGQFAVNRIGKFSNTGQSNDASSGIDEGNCVGKSYPHPTLSMKYLYGIGPIIMYSGEKKRSIDAAENYKECATTFAFSFDGYRESIRGTYSTEDHSAATGGNKSVMANTSSPYFSDFKNYILISPESSYVGQQYFDIIKNSSDLSFENIIYPKSTIPFVSNSGLVKDILSYRAHYKIPVIGGPTIGGYRAISSDYPGLEDAWNKHIGVSISTIGVPNLNSAPSLMYTGAFLKYNDEYNSDIDKSYIYLSLCGGLDSSIVNWVSKNDSYIYDNNVFFENVFSSASRSSYISNVTWPTGLNGELGFESQTDNMLHPISVKTFMSGCGYIDSIVNKIESSPDIDFATFKWKSGFTNRTSPNPYYGDHRPKRNILSIREYGKYLDEGTNIPSFTDKYYLNGTTMKYFRSSLNQQSNNIGSSTYTMTDQLTNTSFVSFIWQNSKSYYDILRNNSPRFYYKHTYNPHRDYYPATTPGYNTAAVYNVWDLKPLKIKISDYIGILKEPTGPFDTSQSIGNTDLINYSKTLSHNLTGSSISSDGYTFNLSPWVAYGSPTLGARSDDDYTESAYFSSMNLINRGRISGKHGAGILISIDGSEPGFTTIPMIGHIGAFHSYAKRYSSEFGIDSKLLYRVDQSVSTHNSTYLVDIRRSPSLKQYSSYADKKNSKYIYTAQTICNVSDSDSEKTIYVFGGDTYVTLFDYTNTYPTYVSPGQSMSTTSPIQDDVRSWNTRYYIDQQTKINSLIPIESFINTHVDAGYSSHKNLNPWDTNEPGMLPVNTGYSSPTISRPNRDLNEYVYDSSYSAKRNFDLINMSFSYDERFNDTSHRSRIIASEPKKYGEMIDSFSIFKESNYIDLDPSSGPITSLQTPLNRLYAFQPGSISYVSLNDRSIINDNTGSQLILGVGGVLPYAQRLSTNYGLGNDTMSFIRCINDRVYFFDDKLKSICVLSDGVRSLSESLDISSLAESTTSNNSSSIFPIYNNDHIVFKFNSIGGINSMNVGSGGSSLVFNVKLGVFESIYTGNIKYGFDHEKKNMLIGSKGSSSDHISLFNNSYLDPIIGFVCGFDFVNTKVFDGVSINLSSKHSSTVGQSPIMISHKYSNSIQSTVLSQIDSKYMNTEGSITASIPRSYDSGTGLSVSRMRDKYIQSMYKFDCGGDEISIPYIKTNFRYSFI